MDINTRVLCELTVVLSLPSVAINSPRITLNQENKQIISAYHPKLGGSAETFRILH